MYSEALKRNMDADIKRSLAIDKRRGFAAVSTGRASKTDHFLCNLLSSPGPVFTKRGLPCSNLTLCRAPDRENPALTRGRNRRASRATPRRRRPPSERRCNNASTRTAVLFFKDYRTLCRAPRRTKAVPTRDRNRWVSRATPRRRGPPSETASALQCIGWRLLLA